MNRRLWGDINLKADYYHYEIDDYVVYAKWGSAYFKKSPWGRRMVNLNEVVKDGLELQINGHLFDRLSFYVSYAYSDWDFHGPKTGPQGSAAEKLGDRARHRVNAGIGYNVFKNTCLLMDYKYQDEQIAHICEEEPPESGFWHCYDNPMDSYHVVNFAIEQKLFTKHPYIKDARVKFYINNLFDEDYENMRGYPMTDRTFGGSISFRF